MRLALPDERIGCAECGISVSCANYKSKLKIPVEGSAGALKMRDRSMASAIVLVAAVTFSVPAFAQNAQPQRPRSSKVQKATAASGSIP